MGKKIIESNTCPTCGHDKGSMQRWELPEVAVIEKSDIDLTPILHKLDELKPKPSAEIPKDFCQEHPELCINKPELEAAKATLEELKNTHPVLSSEYITHQFENCPNCKTGIAAYVDGEITKRGLISPPAKETKPVEEGLWAIFTGKTE